MSDFNARKVIHTKFEQQQIEGNLSPVESFALGIIRGDVCFPYTKKDENYNVKRFEYELYDPIEKDVIFETFRGQNAARTRHIGKPAFWKEFRRVFPCALDYRYQTVRCIRFRRQPEDFPSSDRVMEILKEDFRKCVKDPMWVF